MYCSRQRGAPEWTMSINLTTRMTSACRYTVLVALFSALPTGWAWAEAVSTEPVVVGLAENAGDIPPIIAIDRGFFRAAGLDVRVRAWPAGKQALEAMLAGEVEVATVADTPIVVQSFKRRDFVVIATLAHNNPYRLVARRDRGIRGPSDLRGHRVGVMAGTTTQFFLHSVLADVGLAPGEIAEVDVPAGDLAAAIVSGGVDAVAAFDPQGYDAEKALGDNAVVIPYERIRHEETFNYVVRRDLLRDRPEMVRRLLLATREAIVWMRRNREEAIAVAARRLKIDPAVLGPLWSNYRPALTLDQGLIVSLETQARWAMSMGVVAGTTMPDYLDFLDTAPLDAVEPTAVTLIR